jgi:hypothetical protein
MAVFPTAAHLVAWARFAPQANSAAAKAKTAATGRGTRGWPPPWARSPSRPRRTSTFLGERDRRIAKCRGKQRALVAVGNSA